MAEPEDDDHDDAPLLAERTAEYVERLVGDRLRREEEQEESFLRSLPFFATSLGALLAFIGLIGRGLPPPATAPLTLLAYTLLALTIAAVLAVLWFLSRTLLGPPRRAGPMTASELVRYAGELTEYYSDVRRTGTADGADSPTPLLDSDLAVVAELRALAIEQTAAEATAIRLSYPARRRARTPAFRWLLAALFFALALYVAILTHGTIEGETSHGPDRSSPTPALEPVARRERPPGTEADAAADQDLRGGPLANPRDQPRRAELPEQERRPAGLTTALPPRLFGIDSGSSQ